MWKKEDVRAEPVAPPQPDMLRQERAAPPAPIAERAPVDRAPVQRATGTTERATIGRSITIRGEVTGEEDLLIQGRVEGSVDLRKQAVTVGPEGEVKASIIGRIVTLEGTVEGNITADEQVILRSSAFVQGDITAPRVVLEDGARFRGGVDMGEVTERAASRMGAIAAQTPAKKSPEPARNVGSSATDTSADKPKSSSDASAGVTI